MRGRRCASCLNDAQNGTILILDKIVVLKCWPKWYNIKLIKLVQSHTCCTIVQDQNGALFCITLVKYPIPSIAPHDKMVKSTLFLIKFGNKSAAKTGPL